MPMKLTFRSKNWTATGTSCTIQEDKFELLQSTWLYTMIFNLQGTVSIYLNHVTAPFNNMQTLLDYQIDNFKFGCSQST